MKLRIFSYLIGVLVLSITGCDSPVEEFIEEPAPNTGSCWECDQLDPINSSGKRLSSALISGYYNYIETNYFYDDQDRYIGWEEIDYLLDTYQSETFIYDAQGDLFEVQYFDGVDTFYTPAYYLETSDTIYRTYDLLEYRYAKADDDQIPELVVEYDDYDYLNEWQRFIYVEVADGEYEILNVFDGDTTFYQKFTIDDAGRILSYTDDASFESIYYKYFGDLVNPYPQNPYPSWLPYVEQFRLDPSADFAKVLYNGDLPQMLVDPNGNTETDTLYFKYENF